jgi:hypothetical protein
MTAWLGQRYMATGPGQTLGSFDMQMPMDILIKMVNGCIAGKTSYPNFSQSGMPTLNYAGGQGATINANATVPLVNTFAYTDGANNYCVIAFNGDGTNTHAISFAGTAAPTGTVTKTVFGGPVNALTDNNNNNNLGNNGTLTPPVVSPTPTTITNPSGDTLPAGSLTTYSYSTSGGGGGTAGIVISGGVVLKSGASVQ